MWIIQYTMNITFIKTWKALFFVYNIIMETYVYYVTFPFEGCPVSCDTHWLLATEEFERRRRRKNSGSIEMWCPSGDRHVTNNATKKARVLWQARYKPLSDNGAYSRRLLALPRAAEEKYINNHYKDGGEIFNWGSKGYPLFVLQQWEYSLLKEYIN